MFSICINNIVTRYAILTSIVIMTSTLDDILRYDSKHYILHYDSNMAFCDVCVCVKLYAMRDREPPRVGIPTSTRIL